ncbi:hypothetical protein RB595_005795 [Gaeumannomyces hyphopodioides]
MEASPPPQPPPKPKPRLDIVASASPENQQHGRTHGAIPDRSSSSLALRPFFKSLEWSADGTTVIASSSDDRVCSYVLPQDLLEPRRTPFSLSPQGVLALPEPSRAIAPCPYYSLGYPLTQTVLAACKDHPIQLFSAFPHGLLEESLLQHDADDGEEEDESTSTSPASPSSSSVSSASSSSSSSSSSRALSQAHHPQHQPPLASYNLIKRETEAFITSSSIIWPAPGTHFVAGANNLIAYFDASRTGEGPVSRIPTIPSARHLLKGGGVGMKGTVSTLAAQPDTSLVAAGTWTRWVGLYDLSRADSCVANWSLFASGRGAGSGAGGVVQAIWSPCGRYLVLNERRSTSLAVYDVRVTGRLLSRLVDRDANTNQCLGCDVFASPAGEAADGSIFEVWAGTRDGRVLAWDAVGGHAVGDGEERLSSHTWEWQAHGAASAVGSTALHPGGSVLATCAGSWEVVVDESDSEDSDAGGVAGRHIRRPAIRTSDDTSLRIWSIASGGDAPGQN